jgi:hypothetical protein
MSSYRDVDHLEIRPGRSAGGQPRRHDTPWALLISLLGLAAAILTARLTQPPANVSPPVLVAPPITTDAPTAAGTAPGEAEPDPPSITPAASPSPTVTRIRRSPSVKAGTTATALSATTCRYSYRFSSVWDGGMVAQLTLTNTSGRVWSAWSGGFPLPSVATVRSSWGATMRSAGGWVSVTPDDYNASVPAGGSIALGFQAATTAPVKQLGAFTLNGRTCNSG